MQSTSNEKIAEALDLLEAAAREKQDELRNLVGDKYTHLKKFLMEAEHGAIGSLSATLKREIDNLIRAKNLGQEKVKQAAGAVDEQVHTNPWPYIGGAAVVALLGGYLMGRRSS